MRDCHSWKEKTQSLGEYGERELSNLQLEDILVKDKILTFIHVNQLNSKLHEGKGYYYSQYSLYILSHFSCSSLLKHLTSSTSFFSFTILSYSASRESKKFASYSLVFGGS